MSYRPNTFQVNLGSPVDRTEGLRNALIEVGGLYQSHLDSKRLDLQERRQAEADARATELYNRQIAEYDREKAQRDLLNTAGREAVQRLPAEMLASNPTLLHGMASDAATAFNLSAERLAQGDDDRFKKIHSLMQRVKTGDKEATNSISLEDSNYYRSKVLNSTPATGQGFTSTQSELMSGFDNQLIVKEDAERLLRNRLLEEGIDLEKVEPLVQQYTGGFTTRAQLTEMGKAARERAIEAEKASYEREKDKLDLGIKVLKEVSDIGTKAGASGKVEDPSKYWPAVTPYIHGEGEWANILSSQMNDKELAGMAMGIEANLKRERGLTDRQARNVTLAAINQARSSDWRGVKLTPAQLKVKVKELADNVKPDTAPDANAATREMANKLQEQISKLGVKVKDIPAAASPEQLVVQANTGRLRNFIDAINKPVATGTGSQGGGERQGSTGGTVVDPLNPEGKSLTASVQSLSKEDTPLLDLKAEKAELQNNQQSVPTIPGRQGGRFSNVRTSNRVQVPEFTPLVEEVRRVGRGGRTAVARNGIEYPEAVNSLNEAFNITPSTRSRGRINKLSDMRRSNVNQQAIDAYLARIESEKRPTNIPSWGVKPPVVGAVPNVAGERIIKPAGSVTPSIGNDAIATRQSLIDNLGTSYRGLGVLGDVRNSVLNRVASSASDLGNTQFGQDFYNLMNPQDVSVPEGSYTTRDVWDSIANRTVPEYIPVDTVERNTPPVTETTSRRLSQFIQGDLPVASRYTTVMVWDPVAGREVPTQVEIPNRIPTLSEAMRNRLLNFIRPSSDR